MGSRNLVICDREQEYAAAFAAYLLKKQELALQVQVCQSLEQVKRIREKSEIQVLLPVSYTHLTLPTKLEV